MTPLPPAEEAALWPQVEAILRGADAGAPLSERQQDFLLDRFRQAIAELDDVPPRDGGN